MTTERGFTLIEVLVAVMLTGIISAVALAPVIMTVSRTVEMQREYAEHSALLRTASFIARDINGALRMSPNVILLKDHEAMGGKAQDILMIQSSTPSEQGQSSGTVVYAIAEGGFLHGNVMPGLYRWIFAALAPSSVNTETLNAENAQLVLPNADSFSAEVLSGIDEDSRRKEYAGQLPAGISIRISRGENEYEQIIALP